MEAAEAELSYDWKQILKEHLTNEEMQSYKVQIQNQRKNMVRFAGVLQEIEARGILSTLVRKGKALFSIWNSMDAAEAKGCRAAGAEILQMRKQTGLRNRKALCGCILENAGS